MNPINPWLDPIEVRRLADRLMRTESGPAMSIADVGFDDAFEGFGPEELSEPAPAAAPTVSGLAPEATPTEEPPAAPPAGRGPFLDRISQFRDWLRQEFSATGVFILDREGVVIFDESGHGRLHFLARSLALASRRTGAPAGNVHVKIGAGATLEVIPVDTTYGWFVLGAVVPEALPPAAVSQVMETLVRAAKPPSEGAVTSSDDSAE
jgi:hypothetical protein